MHKSFFGNAFDVGISYEQVVEVHVFASIAMWILAAVQIRIETRKRQSPALHRLTGVVMLLLFFLIVFPSSLYLSALQPLGTSGQRCRWQQFCWTLLAAPPFSCIVAGAWLDCEQRQSRWPCTGG